jgi:hypothetical protein
MVAVVVVRSGGAIASVGASGRSPGRADVHSWLRPYLLQAFERFRGQFLGLFDPGLFVIRAAKAEANESILL